MRKAVQSSRSNFKICGVAELAGGSVDFLKVGGGRDGADAGAGGVTHFLTPFPSWDLSRSVSGQTATWTFRGLPLGKKRPLARFRRGAGVGLRSNLGGFSALCSRSARQRLAASALTSTRCADPHDGRRKVPALGACRRSQSTSRADDKTAGLNRRRRLVFSVTRWTLPTANANGIALKTRRVA